MSQKEALLNGKHHLEPVDLSSMGGPDEVLVRPLTGAESGRVSGIQHSGLKAPVDPVTYKAVASLDDLGSYMEQQAKARIQAVAFGLSHSGMELTVEEVGGMPDGYVRALNQVIVRISGMRESILTEDIPPGGGVEDAPTFRPEGQPDGVGEGPGDRDAGPFPGGNSTGH